MPIITVDETNIDKEHICCSISDKKGECGVALKKEWLKERFKEGLIFQKLDERGKVFIEYLPAEMAWQPIDAAGYYLINCLWVSGKFAGHGYAKELMEGAVRQVKERGGKGLVVLSATKKRGFLGEDKFYMHFGFKLADTWGSYFNLLYLPFDETEEKPQFKAHLKAESRISKQGVEIFYTYQCPFTDKYVKILAECAKAHHVPVTVHHIDSRQAAQSAPAPYTTFSLWINGEFVTHEIPTDKKFLKMIDENE